MFIYESYKSRSISVIVPFYKEGEQIKKNIKILEDELKQHFLNYEVIAVSDGGKNETYQWILELKNIYPRLRVYEYGKNKGKGFALKYGFEKSKGDYIFFIDADMEIHPKEIKTFFDLMNKHDMDIIIGSKRHPQSEINYPFIRRFLSRIYQFIIKIFLDLNIKDTQVGLKLFKRQVLTDCLPRVLVKKYAFDLELLTVANHLGYKKILEAPIKLDFKKNITSNPIKDLIHTFRVGWPLLVDTLAIIYRLKVLKYYDKVQYKVQ